MITTSVETLHFIHPLTEYAQLETTTFFFESRIII